MINNLRYADDTVIITETEEELQQLIDIVVRESGNKVMYLNGVPVLHHGVLKVYSHTYM